MENKVVYKLITFFILNFIITSLFEISFDTFIQFKNSHLFCSWCEKLFYLIFCSHTSERRTHQSSCCTNKK